ncbi:hypothetical protein LJ737_03615 [Hymenobacter sp. 15J16-1T3B]|uniref:S41 family peptidase n=1 Tax=Hymenobacter sp. 15J16-1T3B TaxID=2886941 RepID=UPI001D116877|nr:S41 family peptidase [Hymenobacter sp. 15J16-1T3B]MCC3156308.1 hypothetical protein [Hymenobacter sp. 15J16-1T3B]
MLKSTFLLLALLGPAAAARAQLAAALSMEQRDRRNGEALGWTPVGGLAYSAALDSVVRHAGRYAQRLSAGPEAREFGARAYRVPVHVGGKQVTLTGYLRLAEVRDAAGLWLRVNGPDGQLLAFDNMHQQQLRGTRDWQQFSITLPLAPEARELQLGGILSGPGTVWFDDLRLSIDGRELTQEMLQPRSFPADHDTAFVQGSGLTTLPPLSPRQIENLAVLGRVWGFAKYHHPAVAAGQHNLDAALFRLLPRVLKARSAAARSRVLSAWLTSLGPVPACAAPCAEPAAQVRLPADLAWLDDAKQLSPALRRQLHALRAVRYTGPHYYVRFAANVGNPVFEHEDAYGYLGTPDAGYRLLALFRYWNIIEYYFPYRYAIGEDWQRVLPEFVPKLAAAADPLAYRLAVLELIGRIHDTHASLLGNDPVLADYHGKLYAPVRVSFAEEQAVVTGYLSPEHGPTSGLQRGDVIEAVDGVPVATLLAQRRPLAPASNDAAQLRNLAPNLLRGHAATVQLQVRRAGQPLTLAVPRYPASELNLKPEVPNPWEPYRTLRPGVGYVSLNNLAKGQIEGVMLEARSTRGLVIDARNYPSEFSLFSLVPYLLPQAQPFVKFSAGAPGRPGTFEWTEPLSMPAGRKTAYPGKVVILVNEQTQSMAEYYAMALRTAPRATVLGSTTAGADGNVSPFDLPGGLSTRISGIGVYYPDGRETQRIGIVPDVEVKPTIEGIREGRDEVLDRAVALIETN